MSEVGTELLAEDEPKDRGVTGIGRELGPGGPTFEDVVELPTVDPHDVQLRRAPGPAGAPAAVRTYAVESDTTTEPGQYIVSAVAACEDGDHVITGGCPWGEVTTRTTGHYAPSSRR